MSRAAVSVTRRTAHRAAVLLTLALLVTALSARPAAADFCDESTASYTSGQTSTAGQPCIDAGSQSDAAASGFVLAEATMGALLAFFIPWWIWRKLFSAGGWGT